MQIATADLPKIALQLAIFCLSTAFHEAAHAYTADALGDKTARELGRVTLNPLKHLHWFGSVVLPLIVLLTTGGMLMAGKPVPVQIDRLRNPSRDFMLVAIAGPLSNLLQAILYTGLFVGLKRTGMLVDNVWAYRAFGIAISANIVLMIFNSIPIPPLDGSRFIGYLLPKTIQPWFYRIDPIGFIIIVALIVFTHHSQLLYANVMRPLDQWWMGMYTSWFV